MNRPKVVFLNRIDEAFQSEFWTRVPPDIDVTRVEFNKDSEDEIVAELRDADFLLLLRCGISERALHEAKRLKLIQVFSQGYDRIPLDVTTRLGITLCNAGSTMATAVAEHTVMLMLAVLRRLFSSAAALREGQFAIDLDRRGYRELYQKNVGLVGLGNIGRRIARIVRGFSANVVFYDTAEIPRTVVGDIEAKAVSLEELLRTADIVSIQVPLLPSTRGMIGREQLEMMKPSSLLVNVSRGGVVDEEALIEALQQKRIAGAGLDVFGVEPPPCDNPLLSMENVVATPHVAGYSWESLISQLDQVWENILGVWQGKPPKNVVSTR